MRQDDPKEERNQADSKWNEILEGSWSLHIWFKCNGLLVGWFLFLGKLEALAILLQKLRSDSRRVIIFTQMVKMLDILEAFLDQRQLIYVRVDESLNSEDRQAWVLPSLKRLCFSWLCDRLLTVTTLFSCRIASTDSTGTGRCSAASWPTAAAPPLDQCLMPTPSSCMTQISTPASTPTLRSGAIKSAGRRIYTYTGVVFTHGPRSCCIEIIFCHQFLIFLIYFFPPGWRAVTLLKKSCLRMALKTWSERWLLKALTTHWLF